MSVIRTPALFYYNNTSNNQVTTRVDHTHPRTVQLQCSTTSYTRYPTLFHCNNSKKRTPYTPPSATTTQQYVFVMDTHARVFGAIDSNEWELIRIVLTSISSLLNLSKLFCMILFTDSSFVTSPGNNRICGVIRVNIIKHYLQNVEKIGASIN